MKTKSKLVYVLFASLLIFTSCTEDNPFSTEEEEQQTTHEYTLDDLQGTWLRTGGNHTGNIGMIIEVTENDGVIVDPTTSGFQVDDVKWMNILPNDISDFAHSELGSDYNYYSAIIDFQSDDVIWISVDAAGPGNYQEWTRQ